MVDKALQADYIKELFNVGMGAAADEISQLIGDEVFMSVPNFQLLSWKELCEKINIASDEAVTMIYVTFSGQIEGTGILVYPTAASLELAHRLSNDFSPLDDLTELEEEALSEVSGIIINNIISTMCSQLSVTTETSLPKCERGPWDAVVHNAVDINSQQKIMFIGMSFSIKHKDLKGDLFFIQHGSTSDKLFAHASKALKALGIE